MIAALLLALAAPAPALHAGPAPLLVPGWQAEAAFAGPRRSGRRSAVGRRALSGGARSGARSGARGASSAFYANCSAARAAGAAPVRAGDPGYSRRLDRDGDGVGCE